MVSFKVLPVDGMATAKGDKALKDTSYCDDEEQEVES
jgi:hypothetical protein